MTNPDFFAFRHNEKEIVKKKLEALAKPELNQTTTEITDLSVDDNLSAEHLKAMQFVARMKEAADRVGAVFVGGFISPDGKRFMMTNQEQINPQNK